MSDLPQSGRDLQKIYQERFAGAQDYRRRVWRELTVRFFSTWIAPDAVVLDLGCGYCEFINQIRARKKYGMDLNPDAVKHAASDVTVLQQDCSGAWQIDPGSLDAVFTSNFFEHLPTKTHLEKTLEQALRALRPNGVLIALGPNIRYLPGAYWDFFDHHIALTDRSLTEVLRKCGFTVEKGVDRFLPYTMSDQRTYPIWTLRIYLAVPLLWPIFGKQFLVIARKP
jgi:SAM-dependent methyltransferase